MTPIPTMMLKAARRQPLQDLLIDPLSLNFCFVGLAIIVGWLILEALRQLEALTWGQTGLKIMTYVPLFPLALIGGILVQLLLVRLKKQYLISRPLINHIGGVALDVTIVTALATLSLAAIGENVSALPALKHRWNCLEPLFHVVFSPPPSPHILV